MNNHHQRPQTPKHTQKKKKKNLATQSSISEFKHQGTPTQSLFIT